MASSLKEREIANEGKYLTFALSHEEYGLEILSVREIIGLMDITAVPKVPEYVKGVINLRGKVIPVVDLRLKFCMEKISYTNETCIIVINVNNALIGIIVDKVCEVVDIHKDSIEPPPSFGASSDADFITGMGKVGDKVKILIDTSRIFSSDLDLALNLTK